MRILRMPVEGKCAVHKVTAGMAMQILHLIARIRLCFDSQVVPLLLSMGCGLVHLVCSAKIRKIIGAFCGLSSKCIA